jgi:hypothetical protein
VSLDGGTTTFEHCLFDQNVTLDLTLGEGGAMYARDASCTLLDCQFTNNDCRGNPSSQTDVATRGGAIRFFQRGAVDRHVVRVEGCRFERNQADTGAGAFATGGTYTFERCEFDENRVHNFKGDGGALFNEAGHVAIAHCVAWRNEAFRGSGLASVDRFGTGVVPFSDTRVVGSTFNSNIGDCVYLRNGNTAVIENCVFWGNGTLESEFTEINALNGTERLADVRTTCVEHLSTLRGSGNVSGDPLFVDAFNGNLRLGAGSSCADAGNELVDFEPFTRGFQPTPPFDLDGRARILDGNGDGSATIDMGAFELQP